MIIESNIPGVVIPDSDLSSEHRIRAWILRTAIKRFEADLVAGIYATLACFGFLSSQQMTNGLPIAKNIA
jgi:hypothetical protein